MRDRPLRSSGSRMRLKPCHEYSLVSKTGLADLVHRGAAAEGREVPEQPVRGIDFEEIVDRGVAERLRLLECVLGIERVRQNLGTNHIKSNPTL